MTCDYWPCTAGRYLQVTVQDKLKSRMEDEIEMVGYLPTSDHLGYISVSKVCHMIVAKIQQQ